MLLSSHWDNNIAKLFYYGLDYIILLMLICYKCTYFVFQYVLM